VSGIAFSPFFLKKIPMAFCPGLGSFCFQKKTTSVTLPFKCHSPALLCHPVTRFQMLDLHLLFIDSSKTQATMLLNILTNPFQRLTIQLAMLLK
jgi:hypothetical protein